MPTSRPDQWLIESISSSTNKPAIVEVLGDMKVQVLDCWELLVYTTGPGRFLSRAKRTENALEYLIVGSQMPCDGSESAKNTIEIEFAHLKKWLDEPDPSQRTGEEWEVVNKVRESLRFPCDSQYYFIHAGELQIAGWGLSKEGSDIDTKRLKELDIQTIAEDVAKRHRVKLNANFLKERENEILKTDEADRAKLDNFKNLEKLLKEVTNLRAANAAIASDLKTQLIGKIKDLDRKLGDTSKEVGTLSGRFDPRMLYVAFGCLLVFPVIATFSTWYLTKRTLEKQLVTQSPKVLTPNQDSQTGSTAGVSSTNSNNPAKGSK